MSFWEWLEPKQKLSLGSFLSDCRHWPCSGDIAAVVTDVIEVGQGYRRRHETVLYMMSSITLSLMMCLFLIPHRLKAIPLRHNEIEHRVRRYAAVNDVSTENMRLQLLRRARQLRGILHAWKVKSLWCHYWFASRIALSLRLETEITKSKNTSPDAMWTQQMW